MEKINLILQKRKVVNNHFVCKYCGEDSAYTYFDYETKINRWACPTCGSSGLLRELNAKTPQDE